MEAKKEKYKVKLLANKLRVKQKIWYIHYVQLHSEPHIKYFLKDRPALKHYQKNPPKAQKAKIKPTMYGIISDPISGPD